ENGYGTAHTARQFDRSWFARLDLVIALDSGHLRALRRLAPTDQDAEKVRLLRSYDPAAGDDLDVPHPCCGESEGVVACVEMVEAAGAGLVAAVREHVEGHAAWTMRRRAPAAPSPRPPATAPARCALDCPSRSSTSRPCPAPCSPPTSI